MRLDGFGLLVEDMARMICFHRDVFGPECKEIEDTSNMHLVKDGTLFPLHGCKDFEKMINRRYEYIKGLNGYSEIALHVDTPEEADVAPKNAVENGVILVLEPELEPWGQRTCHIADLEGNLIEIGSRNKPFEEKDAGRQNKVAFNFRREYKESYMPKNKPSIVTVLSINHTAVRGTGDPNQEDGEYKQVIGLLHGIVFTIKMSKKGDYRIEGHLDYVVPPLEGFWWRDGVNGTDYAHKEDFCRIPAIRLLDFVTEDDFLWAVNEAMKKQDFIKVEFLTVEEGLCVQCMHFGSYDDEPTTVATVHEFMKQQDYELGITDKRLHYEVYLSDARKIALEKLKTMTRHPTKVKGS